MNYYNTLLKKTRQDFEPEFWNSKILELQNWLVFTFTSLVPRFESLLVILLDYHEQIIYFSVPP